MRRSDSAGGLNEEIEGSFQSVFTSHQPFRPSDHSGKAGERPTRPPVVARSGLHHPSSRVGPLRSAVDCETNTIDGGTLRRSDSADGGTDDIKGSIQSVFTSHQPFRPSDHSGKAGERPTRPPVVARSGLHHPSSRVGPLRFAGDCETNTIDGGTLRRSDNAGGLNEEIEGSFQSVFTSHRSFGLSDSLGKAGERPTRPPAVARSGLHHPVSRVGPLRSAVDCETNAIDGGTLRRSDIAGGLNEEIEGSIQSVFTSQHPFRLSDSLGKAGEKQASRVGPLRSAVDCETNTIDGGTLRRSDSADGGTDDSELSIQSAFTSYSGKAGKRPTRPPAVSRSSDGTNKISKYFTKTTTTRSTTSPSQVPDTDEVRNDNISPSPLTGCTNSHDRHPARYKGSPPAGVDRNMNLPDSNHEHTPFGKAKMPSELLDDSACDYTTDTTDNNPLESSVTPHHKTTCDNSFPSTLDILVDLGGDESATGANNQHPSDDRDVREAGRVDPIIRDHTEKPPDKTLDRTIGPLDSIRTSNVATENHNVAQTPNKRASKRARGLSGSPDKSYKKTLDENGVIRETVEDIPDTVRNPFFKIRYVPGTIDELEIPNTPLLTVSQQAESKKTMLGRMTGDQAKRWHEGRNSRLTAERLRGRYSWIDQAVENDVNTHWAFGTIGLPSWLLTNEDSVNTHWAFGTIGLPSWLLTNEDSVNQIFQIRSNAAREVMNIARNHLHLEHVKEKQKSTKILEDLERELDADLAATSRQLVSMHTERHLSSFTDELSTRREWLIGHQPSITETISMKPDGRRRDAQGNHPS